LVIEDINKIPFYTPLYQPLPVLAVVPHMFATTVFHEINFLLASYIYVCEYPVRWVYGKVPFCVISESTREDLVGRGFRAGQIEVIHCGIDTEMYRFDPGVPKSQEPLVLYLGRLKKYKSVQHLLRAFARLRSRVTNARLAVVGDGDYRQTLQDLAGRLDLGDAVTFTGFVTPERKVDYLRRAWVAVCPSLKEGWGLTNIEANACGTPVIAADVPGLKDSVRHDETGRLYTYGDIDMLARDLEDMLTDATLRQRFGEGARAWAARFDWDDAAARLGTQIDGIVAASGRGRGR